MNIFEKLMFTKQLNFKEGQINLLDQRLVMFTTDFLSAYTLNINDNPKLVSDIYLSAKNSVKNGFGPGIGKKYSFTFYEFFNWYIDIARLSGWGIIKFERVDEDIKQGVISIENSPVSTYLKGKVKSPCDHIIRGFMAGGSETVFKTEMAIVETECIALGAPQCKFIFGPKDIIKTKYKNLYEQQVGIE